MGTHYDPADPNATADPHAFSGTLGISGAGDARDPVGMTDADLCRAYQATSGEHGDPEADALLAEIERRGLDV